VILFGPLADILIALGFGKGDGVKKKKKKRSRRGISPNKLCLHQLQYYSCGKEGRGK
jgi:hypothetical protein